MHGIMDTDSKTSWDEMIMRTTTTTTTTTATTSTDVITTEDKLFAGSYYFLLVFFVIGMFLLTFHCCRACLTCRCKFTDLHLNCGSCVKCLRTAERAIDVGIASNLCMRSRLVNDDSDDSSNTADTDAGAPTESGEKSKTAENTTPGEASTTPNTPSSTPSATASATTTDRPIIKRNKRMSMFFKGEKTEMRNK